MNTPAAAAAATAATVKAAIKRAGLSVNRAAALSGIPQSTLDRRLLGTPPGFSITELSSLASVLGVEVSDLLRQEAA
jgi:transcriptional regulator with XRE-family HTH domain